MDMHAPDSISNETATDTGPQKADAPPVPTHDDTASEPSGRYLAGLSMAALGIVYGDIGTSPLYSMKESFNPANGLAPSPANVVGIVSLITWTLIIVICVKYVTFVLRADRHGEGGVLALTALVAESAKENRVAKLLLMGLFGTALLYGDGMITPAISVLSAVEGLDLITTSFHPYILPITAIILVTLFSAQSWGTAKVGRLFGPVTLLWFTCLIVLGANQIVQRPEILWALSPTHAFSFFLQNGVIGWLALGSVFLVVTGGEALYADMGHFGPRPIRLAWFIVVLPALLVNYYGQGAFLLAHPERVDNPFYGMVPTWALYPMVALATAATVIASQALISGVFSLTMQAGQLNYLPRVFVTHTSETQSGQIYVPSVNWALMLCCLSLVFGFGSSSALAAAYGVAVTATMIVTTLLFYVLAIRKWNWPIWKARSLCLLFAVLDIAFLSANLTKIPDGGWFPLLVAAVVFTVMTTWSTGRSLLRSLMMKRTRHLHSLVEELAQDEITRLPGGSIYMCANPDLVPPALEQGLTHIKVLHERVLIVSVRISEYAYIAPEHRLRSESLGQGVTKVFLEFGYMDDPHVPKALEALEVDSNEHTFFLGRDIVIPSYHQPGMAYWREVVFAFLNRNEQSATEYFSIPESRVVEIGSQIAI